MNEWIWVVAGYGLTIAVWAAYAWWTAKGDR